MRRTEVPVLASKATNHLSSLKSRRRFVAAGDANGHRREKRTNNPRRTRPVEAVLVDVHRRSAIPFEILVCRLEFGTRGLGGKN